MNIKIFYTSKLVSSEDRGEGVVHHTEAPAACACSSEQASRSSDEQVAIIDGTFSSGDSQDLQPLRPRTKAPPLTGLLPDFLVATTN